MSDQNEALPSAGPVAGKYELVRLIGRGGMGTVWEGRHISLGTRVAIKFIDSEYADSQEARTRFDNEARAAATIQSKHAIQIFDHGVTNDGKPYIVMEMLVGEPLDGRLDRVGRLSLGETARIIRQVARALSRAHERGIVHRDLKPENIFLVRTPDDDDEIAKVLDFGIAKFKKMDGQAAGLTSSTKTGAVLGTPFYMAPEQARGLRDLDYRVDLWSLGVIAFRCVCGALPFEGVSVGDLLVKICTTPAPIPSTVVRTLPPSFDMWFQRALEKDPARRFQSANELSESLAATAGISVRHGLSVSPVSDTGAVPAASNPPSQFSASNPTGATATSAPFTASTPKVPQSSRGIWLASSAAVLVGGVLVLGALQYRSRMTSTNEAGRADAMVGASAPIVATLGPAGASALQATGTPTIPATVVDAGSTVSSNGVETKTEREHLERGEGAPHHHPNEHALSHGSVAKPLPATVATSAAPTPIEANPPLPPRPVTPTPKPTAKPPGSDANVDLGY